MAENVSSPGFLDADLADLAHRAPGVAVLAFACILQLGHVGEHVAQMWQVYVLGLPIERAHGVLGKHFDLEWTHVAFNVALVTILLVARRQLIVRTPRAAAAGMRVLGWATAIETYHTFEHLLRLHQHLVLGVARPPGLLGLVFPSVPLHFTLNAIVLAPMAWALVALTRAELTATAP